MSFSMNQQVKEITGTHGITGEIIAVIPILEGYLEK